MKCFPSRRLLISSPCSSRTFQHLLSVLSAAGWKERSAVGRKSGRSLAQGGLDLTGGRAVVPQSRAYGALRRSHGEQNARNLTNGKRRLGEDACWGGGAETNQRFWQMKCQVKKRGIFTPDHLISSPKARALAGQEGSMWEVG